MANIISRYIFGKPETKEAGAATTIYELMDLLPASWGERNYDQFAKEGYQKNVIVFRCINEIAGAIASLDWRVVDPDGEIIDNHPLIELLKRPNPMNGGASFFQQLETFKQLAGNAYIHRVGPDGRPPQELYLLAPSSMTVVPGSSRIPKEYVYKPKSTLNGATIFQVDPVNGSSEILHLRTANPLNEWIGLSPMEAAAWSVDLHNQSNEWNNRLLTNGARPSGALFVKDYLREDQRSHVKEALKTDSMGSYNAGKPMLFEGDMHWQEMSLSPKDLDFLNAKATAAKDIAMAFRVPPILLNIGSDTTFANMKEARLSLWEDTILPEADYLKDEFNNWLTPLFGDNITLEYDIENVPALAPKREIRWKMIEEATFLTVDEKRAAVGYEPLGAGESIGNPEPTNDEPGSDDDEQDDEAQQKSELDSTQAVQLVEAYTREMVKTDLSYDHYHNIDNEFSTGMTESNQDHEHSYIKGAKKTGITLYHTHPIIEE